MMVDETGMKAALSKLEATAIMPVPTDVELTGYLRNFVQDYIIIAALLTDLLRSRAFSSKCAREMPIAWGEKHEMIFDKLKKSSSNPLVLDFLSWNDTFTLHTGASMVRAGAALMQVIQDKDFIIAFTSHRFSKTDFKRGPTKRERVAVLYAVARFRQSLAERRFTLLTD